jgi:hypothetical protein
LPREITGNPFFFIKKPRGKKTFIGKGLLPQPCPEKKEKTMHSLPGKRTVIGLLVIAAVMMLPLAAQAYTFYLTVDSVSETATNNYAKVDVSISDGQHAAITVTGMNGYYLIDSGAFDFSPQPIINTQTTFTNNPPTAPTATNPIYNVVTLDNANGTVAVIKDTTRGVVNGFGYFTTNMNFDNASTLVSKLSFDLYDSGATWTSALDVFGLSNKNANSTDLTVYFAAAHVSDGINPTFYVANGPGGDFFVPIPPTVWLMGSGLLGLGLMGWRRRKD